jgi:predicted PurR-regulated permease PerM
VNAEFCCFATALAFYVFLAAPNLIAFISQSVPWLPNVLYQQISSIIPPSSLAKWIELGHEMQRSSPAVVSCSTRSQQLSTAFNSFQQLSTAFNSFQQLSTAFNSFQQLSTAFNSFQQLSTAFYSFQQLSTARTSRGVKLLPL